MTRKAYSSVILATLVIMVIYCKTDALQTKNAVVRRCYQCAGAVCSEGSPPTAPCPPERPLCATVASAPDYQSTLTCAAGSDDPCTLTLSTQQSLKMTCVCSTHLCNAPFSGSLQKELLTFASKDVPKNRTDYIDLFWKQSHLANDDDSLVYKMITVALESAVFGNTTDSISLDSTTADEEEKKLTGAPKAEALRYETTMPLDDDEDEGEGSGADEEARAPAPRRPTTPAAAAPNSQLPAAAAPDSLLPAAADPNSRLPAAADPNSLLPGDDNSAYRPFQALVATLPAFYYLLQ